MALVPPLFVTFGVVAILAAAGWWLMKPTVIQNPGVAVYQPPAAKVLEYGWGAKAVEVELAANGVAEEANQKLKLEPVLLAKGRPPEAADQAWAAAKPKQKTSTAEGQQRKDASGQSQRRGNQPQPGEPTMAFRPFRLWAY